MSLESIIEYVFAGAGSIFLLSLILFLIGMHLPGKVPKEKAGRSEYLARRNGKEISAWAEHNTLTGIAFITGFFSGCVMIVCFFGLDIPIL